MKKIQMLDLIGQYEKIQKEVDESVMGVLKSAAYINGPEVKSFQAELEQFLGVKHVIPCANGTDALQIAMMALELQPGDEVIVPSFTYVATAEVIALLRLTPVLVDVDEHTFNIDISRVEKLIGPKTKAIVPVHLFGQCADMEPLLALAKKHNLYVIEDNAQAIGADYIFSDGRKAKGGTMGHIGTTSYYPTKNLGCFGDGGAIFTNDDNLANKMRMVANHGQSTLYYFERIGVNSRLDSIQAAILRIKLRHLPAYNAARNTVANYYDKAFAGHKNIITPVRAKNSTHVFHQYTLRVLNTDRDNLKKQLGEMGIPSMVYYPLALHEQKAYADPRYKQGDFPVSEMLCKQVISLPMHTEMTTDQLQAITEGVLKCMS